MQFIDIGANMLDERFTDGKYRGTYHHEPDLDKIMERAVQVGITRLILTAGTVQESREAVQKAREWNKLYPEIHFTCTVGVHPTRCQQVFEAKNADPDALLKELLEIAQDGMKDKIVVAVGELGLDYDRLKFCPKYVQRKYFLRQLQEVAKPTGLPLFLHNRAVGHDLFNILSENRDLWTGGVVHSFTDSAELGKEFIEKLDLYIGLNGCSLKTEESLEVVKQLPLERLMLETGM